MTYGVARLETSLVIYLVGWSVWRTSCEKGGTTYHINTAISCDGNDRVEGAEINTDDRHLERIISILGNKRDER